MSNNKILVIGGAGYVGSHFSRYAASAGFDVTVIDNLSTGHSAAAKGHRLLQGDLHDREFFTGHLADNRYSAIFHFAASCLVGESVAHPAKYYYNNVIAAHNMLEAMRATNHDQVVFSSTCAVSVYRRSSPCVKIIRPIRFRRTGRTKLTIEWMLEDYYHAYGIRSSG